MKRHMRNGLLAGAAMLLATALPAAAQTGRTVSGDVVRIGVITDLSGVFSDQSGKGSVAAAQMAVEDFGGKVLGKPVELLSADHQNKVDIGSAVVREWIDAQGVDLVQDVANSGLALAVADIVRDKNRIAIFNGPSVTRLTGDKCTPNTIHYAYDAYSLAKGTGTQTVKQGGDSWFFLTVDFAFGHGLEENTAAIVKDSGGKVLGAVRFPLNSMDFASYINQAQASKAKIIGLATTGTDARNAIKAASEFGLTQGGQQQLAGLLLFDTDIHALGLEATQGMYLTTAFYWDRNEETRAFSKRFFDRVKIMPNMGQAGVYSSTLAYLKAVEAAGTDEAGAVMAKMKSMRVNDVFVKDGWVREDGRFMREMYLMQVKKPSESKYPWDYYHLRATIPADEAFRPLAQSDCPLVKK
ncbi:ABC transporter substrate-binding protein [Azospirillum oleiclasticum]|nr:ABC transporter substrate-binding protein [Azospirillum oleiclasticum]